MNKAISIILALFMVVSITACSENDVSTNGEGATNPKETVSIVEEGTSGESISEETAGKEEENDKAVWKEFLKEYEAWVDNYIAVLNKYKESPTDLSILSDYSKMIADLADWTERIEDVQDSIMDAEDAVEYSKEILRIAGKLAEAGQ